MNGALLRHTWRVQRTRLAIVSIALAAWGFLHPISISLISVFAVGVSAWAIAGERQRGTLEVALARPVSRRQFHLTLVVATCGFIAVTTGSLLVGGVVGSWFAGVGRELAIRNVPLLWLNGVLLFGAIGAVGLAASASFDRFAPSLGVTLGIVVSMYFLEILGSLWPDAEFLQPYSLFHYLRPKVVLTGGAEPLDFAVLATVGVVAVLWALVVFPRRDLAAPS